MYSTSPELHLGYYSGFRTLGMGIFLPALETMGGTGQEIRFQSREELHMTQITLLSTSATLHFLTRIFGDLRLRTAS